jgi:DNA-directed RNA polymerase subunit RPC12/RpoP
MKLCKLCHLRPATLPDREEMGRPIKAVCFTCHRQRLEQDLQAALGRRCPQCGAALVHSRLHGYRCPVC